MRKLGAVLFLAASMAACSKSTTPPSVSAQSGEAAKSFDPVQQKLVEVAGSKATDCGRVKSQAADQTQKAGDCAMKAAKDKNPFYVAYEMPGLTVGVAGNSEGKLFSIQSEEPETPGAKAEVKSLPCPSELRFAQSGRVTCMTPGSGMSTMGGGANPHGAMPPASGQNPHGGITMPNLGTSQGTAKPSYPPTNKTPPKQ